MAEQLITWAWRAYRWGIDLVLPPQCVGCGKVGLWLCPACAQQIPLWEAPQCPRCGRPWEGEELCTVCRESPLQVAPIRSTFLFQAEIRDVMHALKYRGGHQVIRSLTPRMVEAWQRAEFVTDLLVPVPLHPRREAKRGYNQANLLACALGEALDVPVASRLLRRTRATVSQTKLNRKQRRENVSGAFTYPDDILLDDMHLTLVDDVATTGATLEACADVLLAHGAERVSAFTLARAP